MLTILKKTTQKSWLFTSLLTAAMMTGGVAASEPQVVRGITEASRDIALGLAVPGRVAGIDVKAGQWVEKGQRLLYLDNRLEELEVERRKLQWQATFELDAARLRQKVLKSQLESSRRLYNSTQSISREALEQQEMDYALAQTDVQRLELAEQREKIEYQLAQEQLARRVLVAPASGIINKIELDVSESAEANQQLIHLVDTSTSYFIAHIEQHHGSHRLQQGDTVTVRLQQSGEAVEVQGQVEFFSPIVDPASGLRELKIAFTNTQQPILPGVAGELLLPQLN